MARKAQNMIKYIFKRILLMFPMIFVVLLITFVLSRALAGDPTMYLFPPDIPLEERQDYLRELGLLDPWPMQLLRYLTEFFTGDLGTSFVVVEGWKISDWIAVAFPRSFELLIIPTAIVPILGVKMGITSAANQNKSKDQLIRGLGIIGVAFPTFWVGMIIQAFSGIFLQEFSMSQFWFPTSGVQSFRNIPDLYLNIIPEGAFRTGFRTIDCLIYNQQLVLQDYVIHLILPISCMCLMSVAGSTRITRTTMLDVLQQDYIRTARAKGCLEKEVYNKHALRNAMIPTATMIVGGIGASLVGSFIIEQVFNIFGLGLTFFLAIMYRDYFLINALAIYVAIIIIIFNLIRDVMYTIIDPRIIYT